MFQRCNYEAVVVVVAEHPNMENRSVVANLATVAVLAISDDVPLTNFTLELQHALKAIGMYWWSELCGKLSLSTQV